MKVVMISPKAFQIFIGLLVSFIVVLMIIRNHHSLLTVSEKHVSNDLSSYKQHQPTFSPCNPKQQTNQQNFEDLQHLTNEFDGCYHVFLDVGSNLGNTVRKLYEPHLFPEAQFLPIFDAHFGMNKTLQTVGGHSVCAVGFEPNANLAKGLKNLEIAYNKCGWRTKFYTETAASHTNGHVTFYSDSDDKNFEWGASIVKSKIATKPIGCAKMMRLSDYVLQKVITRKLPIEILEKKPSVVMKLDIEGSELEVLTDLLVTGSLQHIDLVSVEYHPLSFNDDVRPGLIRDLEKAMNTITNLGQHLGLKSTINIKNVDDETYGKDLFPIPDCGYGSINKL